MSVCALPLLILHFSMHVGEIWVFGISELELLASFPQRVRGFLMSSDMCERLCTLNKSVQIFILTTISWPHSPSGQGHITMELRSWTLVPNFLV